MRTRRRNLSRLLVLVAGIGTGLLALPGYASAGFITYSTGNQQYTNVNINADQNNTTIVGEVDHTGITVDFNGFAEQGDSSGPGTTAVPLHGQHGVAFIEPDPTSTAMRSMTITAQAGFGFHAFDLKLDNAGSDGTVFFFAFDKDGNLIGTNGGPNSFFFDSNGQNPYQGITDSLTTVIKTLVIETTQNIRDLKQVSVDLVTEGGQQVVPEPASMILAGTALPFAVGFVLRRRRLNQRLPA